MNKKNIIIIVLGALILAGIAFISMSVFTKNNLDYVAKVNGTEIDIKEYLIYLREQRLAFEMKGGIDIWETDFDGTSATVVAKQNALDSIVYVKVMNEMAKANDLKLNELELDQCRTTALSLYASLSDEEIEVINYEDIEVVIIENALLEKFYFDIVGEITVDDSGLPDFIEENIDQYGEITVNSLEIGYQESEENGAREAITQLNTFVNKGQTLLTAYENYKGSFDVFYNEEIIVAKENFSVDNFLYIKELPVGAVSGIISETDKYYILEIVHNTYEDKEIIEHLENMFAAKMQKEAFDAIYSEILRSATVEKNSPVWDQIEIH